MHTPTLSRCALLALLTACIPEREPEAAPITCDELADSCWSDAVDEVAACRPASPEGQFSKDEKTCSFADGSEVVFHLPARDSELSWDFELTSGTGEPCFSFETTHLAQPDPWVLTTARGTVTYDVDEIAEVVRLGCPGGRTFEMTTGEHLACGFAHMPGKFGGWSLDGRQLHFGLRRANEDVTVFDCVR